MEIEKKFFSVNSFQKILTFHICISSENAQCFVGAFLWRAFTSLAYWETKWKEFLLSFTFSLLIWNWQNIPNIIITGSLMCKFYKVLIFLKLFIKFLTFHLFENFFKAQLKQSCIKINVTYHFFRHCTQYFVRSSFLVLAILHEIQVFRQKKPGFF